MKPLDPSALSTIVGGRGAACVNGDAKLASSGPIALCESRSFLGNTYYTTENGQMNVYGTTDRAAVETHYKRQTGQ
jgi:hypothetical protein